ncbi:MAG TPA: hypothetical protein VNS22_03335 [Geminicoccus sp.]|uniref:hypothetical protein n=1 Tax=Geminicoccus sp. TaxID=2024832 RepID=UPI002B768EF3|nr:hypothetical protein [Geminicoccus sp.]HWL67398.1 hypothetical protein [Geminicoccus sp.]
MKKQRHRPAPRRKAVHHPRPVRASSSADQVAGYFPDLVDYAEAINRATAARMPAEVADEFHRLIEVTERSAEEAASLEVLSQQYDPPRNEVDAQLKQLKSEYEQKSRGSFEADVAAALEMTVAAIRSALNETELAAFDLVAARLNEADGVERQHEDEFSRLVGHYLRTRVDGEVLGLKLHQDGVSVRQISARYPQHTKR